MLLKNTNDALCRYAATSSDVGFRTAGCVTKQYIIVRVPHNFPRAFPDSDEYQLTYAFIIKHIYRNKYTLW